jgi:RNA polymerase sigma-70 factor, ECF subfamily
MTQQREKPALQDSGEPPLDINIVLRAQAGDEEAFNCLYLQYFRPIGIFLTHLVNNEEIGRELAQDTFLRAWEKLYSLHQPTTFPGWLYRIARNIAYDHLRHTKHDYSVYLTHEHEGIIDGRYGEPDEQVEAVDCLKCALTAVSWEYRVPLVLYHIRGMSKAHIAELLDLEESSVRTYISRGMRELSTYLLQNRSKF